MSVAAASTDFDFDDMSAFLDDGAGSSTASGSAEPEAGSGFLAVRRQAKRAEEL